MMARIGPPLIVVFWVVMTGWLAWHDLWPAWTAQDPPKATPGTSYSQVGIFDRRGERIGTAWTTQTVLDLTALRSDCLWIERFPGLPPTRIEVDSTYTADGRLDDLEVLVYGHGVPIELKGQGFPSAIAFELRIGHQLVRTFNIPHAQARGFGDLFRPFAALGVLKVGQSWRMQVFNPLAAVTGLGEPFTALLVRVVGTQTLVREGKTMDCFVVETAGSRALVGPDGVVYEQTVELPVGGTLTIRDEPYDPQARQQAKSLKLWILPEENHAR